jgi:hypothetical protein
VKNLLVAEQARLVEPVDIVQGGKLDLAGGSPHRNSGAHQRVTLTAA